MSFSLHRFRSPSLKTAARTMFARRTWSCRQTWTSPGRGTHLSSSVKARPASRLFWASLSSCRQTPYVIRTTRKRLMVDVQLQNRLENAYNTSLKLHYSRNLHFSSLSIRVNHLPTHPVGRKHSGLSTFIHFSVTVGGCQLEDRVHGSGLEQPLL